eukprot:2992026-Amphidinium_carterae.1
MAKAPCEPAKLWNYKNIGSPTRKCKRTSGTTDQLPYVSSADKSARKKQCCATGDPCPSQLLTVRQATFVALGNVTCQCSSIVAAHRGYEKRSMTLSAMVEEDK